MTKAEDFLQTATPEGFSAKLMKCPQGGKILMEMYRLALAISKKDPLDRNGQYVYGTQEFIDMKDEFRKLVISELNHVLENEK